MTQNDNVKDAKWVKVTWQKGQKMSTNTSTRTSGIFKWNSINQRSFHSHSLARSLTRFCFDSFAGGLHFGWIAPSFEPNHQPCRMVKCVHFSVFIGTVFCTQVLCSLCFFRHYCYCYCLGSFEFVTTTKKLFHRPSVCCRKFDTNRGKIDPVIM